MRIKPDESYKDWAERARMYEYGLALQQIAEGKDPEKVMEKMSRRLMDKLVHPLLKGITEHDLEEVKKSVEQSRLSYEEHYLKLNAPRADHIDD